jgi:sialidase-1
MFQRYPLGIGEGEVGTDQLGPRSCLTAVMSSDDDGATWTRPRDITTQVKRSKGVTSTASGPGVGIQLRQGTWAGRLVVPFNQGPKGDWHVYAALSDDGGDTWRMGDVAPDGGRGRANECQLAEVTGGELLMVARQENGAGARKVTRSTDGGEHWSRLSDDPTLPCPSCMGGIAAITPERLVFTGPNSRRERRDGSAWFSFDGGRTWPVLQPVYGGVFAYSQPALLPDGGVGVLFERDGYRKISFVRVPVPAAPPAAK